MAFIEESDLNNEEELTQQSYKIDPKDKLRGPLTAFQQERKQLKIIEEKEEKKENISDEERERTIRCLLKCMEYQMEGVTQQANEIQAAVRRNDQEMKAYEQELRDRANKIRLEEMNQALENTKKIAGAYKYSTKVVREDENGEIVQLSDAEDEVELEERVDVVELISDNQVLLNRVDQLLIENKQITVD